MDFTGTFLGILTIPMVMLNIGAALSALALLARGDIESVAIGLGGASIIHALAAILRRIDGKLARFARTAISSGRRSTGYATAWIASGVPVAIIVIAAIVGAQAVRGNTGSVDPVLWLWSYGAVTGAWTYRAWRANKSERTLAAIRSYAAQLGYGLFSAALLGLGLEFPPAFALLLAPMILPLMVGMLIAIADPRALKDVQV